LQGASRIRCNVVYIERLCSQSVASRTTFGRIGSWQPAAIGPAERKESG
jgi:hypothetical protein